MLNNDSVTWNKSKTIVAVSNLAEKSSLIALTKAIIETSADRIIAFYYLFNQKDSFSLINILTPLRLKSPFLSILSYSDMLSSGFRPIAL